jgi:hypothetical protein
LVSTTIDHIVGDSEVGLIHLDVEGSEFEVLVGALDTVKRCNPVIIFEQHLISDKPEKIIDILKQSDYRLMLINEVLPGNKLDCRNFIALPNHIDVEVFSEALRAAAKHSVFVPATYGGLVVDI